MIDDHSNVTFGTGSLGLSRKMVVVVAVVVCEE